MPAAAMIDGDHWPIAHPPNCNRPLGFLAMHDHFPAPIDHFVLASYIPAWFGLVLILQWIVPLTPGVALIAAGLAFPPENRAGWRLTHWGAFALILGVIFALASIKFGGPYFLIAPLLSR